MHGFSTSTHTLFSKTIGALCPSRRETSTLPRWSPPTWATTRVWWWIASPRAKFTARQRLWSSGQTVSRRPVAAKWLSATLRRELSILLFKVALIIARTRVLFVLSCLNTIDSPSANAWKWTVAPQCRPANKSTQISSLLTLPSCNSHSL